MRHSILHFGVGAKAFRLLSLVLLMAAFSLSSCRDKDTDVSMALSGQWRGDFGMYYDYVDGHGRRYTFDSYDSRITFIPAYSYAIYGRGTQVDYYDYGPYEYQYYQFSWRIKNGVVYLSYDYDPQLDTSISDYRMTNDYFSGTFSSSGTSFRLYKLEDYYNWTPYVNIYGYGDRDNWYDDYPNYAPLSRSDGEQLADSVAAEGKVVSRGRRCTPLRQ